MSFYLIAFALCVVALMLYKAIFGEQTPLPDADELEAEFELVNQQIHDNTLESIRIDPEPAEASGLKSSKFGGYPWWPSNLDYPLDRKGKPLRLLAQINLSELPANNLLPTDGPLQFFIADQGNLGLEYENKIRTLSDIIDAPTEYRVFCHQDTTSPSVDTKSTFPITAKSTFPFTGEYSLNFHPNKSRVNPMDYRFDEIIKNSEKLHEATLERVFETFDTSGCKLGGYANFTQEDPRTLIKDEQWVLLFQMDTYSKNGVDIMWGDAGVANFFIRPTDLKNEVFSKVWFNWDCC
jgi:uncharacterized protein YwqG